jgi:ribose transport system permease protein
MGGVDVSIFGAIAVALGLWIILEHTATGRRLYAAGFNPEAARLANIRTDRLRFCALITSAGIAGFAGIVLASQLGAGSTTAGTSYLLPAYAAAFVGATQFKGGRPNAWGTVVAVLMLGTGILGLGLANAPSFSANLFTGIVMIVAIAAVGVERRTLQQGRTTGPRNFRSVLRLRGSRSELVPFVRHNTIRDVPDEE